MKHEIPNQKSSSQVMVLLSLRVNMPSTTVRPVLRCQCVKLWKSKVPIDDPPSEQNLCFGNSCMKHKIPINKLTSVFYASVLLLMINCVITLSKWLWNCSAVNSSNVVTQFFINKRTDAKRIDVNLFYTITKPQNGQMLRINEGKRRRKLAIKKAKWISFKMTRTLSIAFLAFWLAT